MLSAILLSALLAAPPRGGAQAQSLAGWYEGPVRYLITRREEKEFKSLRDDVARSEYIRGFWRKRDPIPQTPENEARIAFWRRVVEANRLFDDSAAPGWKTDRGKVYILAGPPNEIQEDPYYNVGDPHIANRGLVRWIYEGTLQQPQLGGTFVVPFVRDNDGEYHISQSARFASPAFDPLNSYDRGIASITRIQSAFDYGPSDLGVAMDQALLQTPPWQDKDFIDRVTSEVYLGALPMEVGFDFLLAADGSTFALINCAVPLSAFTQVPGAPTAPDVTVVGRLSPEPGGAAIDVAEGTFLPAPTNAAATGDQPLLYQARVPLKPGRYDLYIGLFERVRLQAANLRSVIEIPDLSGPLSLSSVSLGRSIRPLPEGAGDYHRAYRISDFEFIPAVGGVFRTGGTFAALWQIYSDGPSGPGSGLEVVTRFYHRNDQGTENPIGQPRVVPDAQAVQGYSLELSGWPPGLYRFEVTIKDRKGRTATRSAGFRVQ